MAKAMAVAVLGDEVLMPRGYRHSGLVWIYVAICGSIPAQGGLWWAADSFITGDAGRAAQVVQLQEQLLCCSSLCTACLPACHLFALLRPRACNHSVPQSAHAAHRQHRRHHSLPSPVSNKAACLGSIGPVSSLIMADPNSMYRPAWTAGMQREPEAAVSSGTDSSSPLLEKGLGSGSSGTDAGGKPEQGAGAAAQESKVAPKVVRALLGMSAVDTPLILVAFAAGEGPGTVQCRPALSSSTRAATSLYPCTSSPSMSSIKQAGGGL